MSAEVRRYTTSEGAVVQHQKGNAILHDRIKLPFNATWNALRSLITAEQECEGGALTDTAISFMPIGGEGRAHYYTAPLTLERVEWLEMLEKLTGVTIDTRELRTRLEEQAEEGTPNQVGRA